MASWATIEQEAPALAAAADAFLRAHTHLVLATLRRGGAPRVSGIELLADGGERWLGMMAGSRKGADLRRDPRFALHSGSDDPPAWQGDAKLAGTAIEVTALDVRERVLGAHAGEGADLFRLDIAELVVVRLGDPADHLVIESWHEGRGTTRLERR